MISTYKRKKTTWIDLESPTTDEVKFLMEKYDVHPLVAEELLRPTLRPKVDNYQNSAYLILHFPTLGSDFKKCDSCEVDFIIGKNFLITVHYQAINSLIELGKIFEADALLGENNLSKNAGILFFHIVRNLYELSMKQIDNLQMQIEEIEQKMFEKKGSQYNLVRKISHVRRDIWILPEPCSRTRKCFPLLNLWRQNSLVLNFCIMSAILRVNITRFGMPWRAIKVLLPLCRPLMILCFQIAPTTL